MGGGFLRVESGGGVGAGASDADVAVGTREGVGVRGIESKEMLRNPRQVCEADLKGADLVVALKEAEHRPWLEKLHPAWAGVGCVIGTCMIWIWCRRRRRQRRSWRGLVRGLIDELTK